MQLRHQTVKIILTQNMTLSLTPEGKTGLGLDIRLQSPPSQPPRFATMQHQGSLSLTVTCCSEMCSCRVWLSFCNEVLSTVLLNSLLFLYISRTLSRGSLSSDFPGRMCQQYEFTNPIPRWADLGQQSLKHDAPNDRTLGMDWGQDKESSVPEDLNCTCKFKSKYLFCK